MSSVSLVQVPHDSGMRDRRMGRGPGRLLELGAVELLERAAGPVERDTVQYEGEFPAEIETTFWLLQAISGNVEQASTAGRFPLLLAGNCNSTVGALAGIPGPRVGLAWFDGHGDFNTPETTDSGFLDGMGLSMTVGHCWTGMCNAIRGFRPLPEANVALIGTRDLDAAESGRLRVSAISRVACEEVHGAGPSRALETLLDRWSDTVDSVYLHIDLDVHDPESAPANALQPAGGLSPREVRDCIEAIADRYTIAGASITAYDPARDREDAGAEAGLALVELLGRIAQRQGA